MATRYSGDLKISVTLLDDEEKYRTVVSRGGKVVWKGYVGPSPDLSRTISLDSAKAYDEMAKAALAHAGKRISSDDAEYDDSGYKIRRVKGYWKKWPGGQVKPKRLRDPSARKKKTAKKTTRARYRFPKYTPHAFQKADKVAKDYRQLAKHYAKQARALDRAVADRRRTHKIRGYRDPLTEKWRRQASTYRLRAKRALERAWRHTGVYSRDR